MIAFIIFIFVFGMIGLAAKKFLQVAPWVILGVVILIFVFIACICIFIP